MGSYYDLDDLKNKLRREVAEANTLAEAWGKVSYPVKKDGKPFANMAKNIDGAKYNRIWHAMQDGEYELTVYAHCSVNGYIHDSINLYELVRYLKDDDPRKAKVDNYLPKISYLEQVYKYDLDDIKEKVANRIKYWRNRAEDLEKELECADKLFADFREAYKNAMKILEDGCKEFTQNDLYYGLRDLVKERYPYC